VLSEEEYKEIQRLHIRLSREADSHFIGDYRSSFRGKGIEFADVRPYIPGDEIRRIDWNVTARTGYPHVKEFKEEREQTLMLMVDVSASMYFGSKKKVCSLISGALAFAAMRNQDNVGLILFGNTVSKIMPPKKKNGYVWRIIQTLFTHSYQTKGTSFSELVNRAQQIIPKNSMVIVLSDFMAPDWRAIGRLYRKERMHGFLIHDPLEQKIPFSGLLDVVDSETQKHALIDTDSISTIGVQNRLLALQEYGIQCCSFSRENDVIRRLRQHFVASVPQW
jgi:uncharacterized protein (DUF58 family)